MSSQLYLLILQKFLDIKYSINNIQSINKLIRMSLTIKLLNLNLHAYIPRILLVPLPNLPICHLFIGTSERINVFHSILNDFIVAFLFNFYRNLDLSKLPLKILNLPSQIVNLYVLWVMLVKCCTFYRSVFMTPTMTLSTLTLFGCLATDNKCLL